METDDGRARQVRLEGQAGRAAKREARPRRAVWRSRFIERCGDAATGPRDRLEIRWKDAKRNRERNRGRLDGGVVQPDDASLMTLYFGAVVIVRLEVSMRDGVRMVTIGFVNVLGRDDRQKHHARREHAGDRRAPE